MSLILTIIVIIVVLALVIWAIQSYLPIGLPLKNLICFLCIVVALLIILNYAGIIPV